MDRGLTLDDIQAARNRIAGVALRTPLVRLNQPESDAEIHLKLENLQPIGSFKIRGAASALALVPAARLAGGAWTASAGNMAQGVAWVARRAGVPCTVVAPDTAPAAKVSAVERLGARVIRVPFDRWWQTFEERTYPGLEGVFVHAFDDPAVMAGNGTIGLEILEDLPDVDVVIVPFGGGGLSCGIASALRAVRPQVRIFAAEVETAAPLAASLAAGKPVSVEYVRSFVDGIGSKTVMSQMFERARTLLDGSIVVSLADVAAAVRLLAERNHVVAEGAGATAVAAALTGKVGPGRVACILSGGNIDSQVLAAILEGRTP